MKMTPVCFRKCVRRMFSSTLTDLPGGDDVEKLGMLIDSQTEDVIRVLQIKALSSCEAQTPSVLQSV